MSSASPQGIAVPLWRSLTEQGVESVEDLAFLFRDATEAHSWAVRQSGVGEAQAIFFQRAWEAIRHTLDADFTVVDRFLTVERSRGRPSSPARAPIRFPAQPQPKTWSRPLRLRAAITSAVSGYEQVRVRATASVSVSNVLTVTSAARSQYWDLWCELGSDNLRHAKVAHIWTDPANPELRDFALGPLHRYDDSQLRPPLNAFKRWKEWALKSRVSVAAPDSVSFFRL